MTNVGTDYSSLPLFMANPEDRPEGELKQLAEQKQQKMQQWLATMNPGGREIANTDTVFARYKGCLDWMKAAYTARRLEEMLGAQVDPLIRSEHNYVIQSLMKKAIAEGHAISLIHEQRNPFRPELGDSYEKVKQEDIEMLDHVIEASTSAVSVTLNHLKITDQELQSLIPAIHQGKIETLDLTDNNLSGSLFHKISLDGVATLILDKNPINSHEAILHFAERLQNKEKSFYLSLQDVALSEEMKQILNKAQENGHSDTLFIA